jgi:putative transposase
VSALIVGALEDAVGELAPLVGRKTACSAVGLPRASYYRAHPVGEQPRPDPEPEQLEPRRQGQPRALTEAERTAVLGVLHSERFADAAPATVYATLLDEGTYLASESTMYRLLRARGETGDRRRHATHPAKVKPELVASTPNQVWSWDITKLHGPAKWTYFYLYVILDIFSRYPVGWMVAFRESAVLAERLIAEAVRKQQVDRGQLTLHADRGSSMASKPVAFLLADLGVTKSHSRPHCSNDNPFSEAQFKTLKYRPDFPERFGSIEDAVRSATASSAGTPTNIGTPGSGSTLPLTSTTATPTLSARPAAMSWTPLTTPTPRGSSGSHHSHRDCPAPSGSTSPRTRRSRHSNYFKNVSQKG